MSTLRCASSVVGAASLVEPISLGSLVLDVPCFSLHTSRILCSWSRRAVLAISSTLTTAADGVDIFSHVRVACGDPVKVWTTPRRTNKSSDVTQRSQNHSPQPLACGSHIGFASHVPDSPTPCENISTALCALTYRILPQLCVKVCNVVALWQLRQIMAEKSARCDALRNVCVLVVLRERPWSTASRKRQRRYIVDLLFPYANEKAQSISGGHLELSALRAIMWCFVSSVRQGSRGLLLHRHCVSLTGRPRIHVAVQPSSGLRSIAMMYTKLLH